MAAPAPHLIPGIEREVLGSALLDEVACSQLCASFDSSRFLLPAHQTLAEQIEDVYAQGHHVTASGLIAYGADAALVTDCVSSSGSTTSVPYQLLLLAEAHLARSVQDVLRLALRDAGQAVDGTADVFDVVERAQRAISEAQLQAESSARSETHIRHAVAEGFVRVEEWKAGEATDLASSGFYGFDKSIGGFPVGELTTLAAMTGAGKTSLLGQSVVSVALQELARAEAHGIAPAPVVVFSAEMSREQIVHRIASGLSGVNLRRLRSGKAAPEEWERYEAALARLVGLNIHVDDEPAPTFAHIAARLHQIRQSAPGKRLALVGVDYDEKVHTKGASEELRVSAIAVGLKNTAKRFSVAVLALSQYSRKANPGEIPLNDWLRYSGKKEHESAMIVHWMWPQYWADKGYKPDKIQDYDANRPERGYLVVTKNRNGPSGRIELDFDRATTSFRDPNEPGQRATVRDLARRPPAARDATSPTEGEMEREAQAFRDDPSTDDTPI